MMKVLLTAVHAILIDMLLAHPLPSRSKADRDRLMDAAEQVRLELAKIEAAEREAAAGGSI